MKKTIVSTNWLNKVIAAMMTMAITTAMPAMAGNKTTVSTSRQHVNNGKTSTVVVVTPKKASHFDKADKRVTHLDAHKKNAHHPVVKTCTFKVSRHAAHHNVVAKAERIHGVMDAHWNPRTHEMTVRYDARVTSAHHIMHSVA